MKKLGLLTAEKRRETSSGREEKELRTIDEGGNRCYKLSILGNEEVTSCLQRVEKVELVLPVMVVSGRVACGGRRRCRMLLQWRRKVTQLMVLSPKARRLLLLLEDIKGLLSVSRACYC